MHREREMMREREMRERDARERDMRDRERGGERDGRGGGGGGDRDLVRARSDDGGAPPPSHGLSSAPLPPSSSSSSSSSVSLSSGGCGDEVLCTYLHTELVCAVKSHRHLWTSVINPLPCTATQICFFFARGECRARPGCRFYHWTPRERCDL